MILHPCPQVTRRHCTPSQGAWVMVYVGAGGQRTVCRTGTLHSSCGIQLSHQVQRLFVGSFCAIPCPLPLPTLPANACRCVSLFNQHLGGHFLLPTVHHRGRCCPAVLEVKSLVCISQDPTLGHSPQFMTLPLPGILRWSRPKAVVT